MSRSARVTSIDVLPLLAAALQKFRAEGAAAIDELDLELHRATEWIHHDRKDFWSHESYRANEALNQARLQLQQARISKRIGDQEPGCIDEKRALEKAKRRVETARWKMEAVRHWSTAIERAADDFRRARTQFTIWLDVDLSRAVATLNQMSESLVSYISMESPSESDEASSEAAGENEKNEEMKGTEEVVENSPPTEADLSRQPPPSPTPSGPSGGQEAGA